MACIQEKLRMHMCTWHLIWYACLDTQFSIIQCISLFISSEKSSESSSIMICLTSALIVNVSKTLIIHLYHKMIDAKKILPERRYIMREMESKIYKPLHYESDQKNEAELTSFWMPLHLITKYRVFQLEISFWVARYFGSCHNKRSYFFTDDN